ncbi:hypothetical protein OHA72_47775 [Dactylosporangium sp. NBC_01737]|uniref:hypothetical protein n=1 Tax=Dactylosporangium sp. NBC_01737 TaxID=2975959 RepID=UPI002E106A67|nr:hypothetical protein OHA72_47775 [Dactylosporangium sp. NBC_01737]
MIRFRGQDAEARYDAVVRLDLDFFDQSLKQCLPGLVIAVRDDVRDVVPDFCQVVGGRS